MASIMPDAEQQQQQPQQQMWPKQLNGIPLSRASSNSSLGASPARPPKSDRRRSSASPESVLQYTMNSSISSVSTNGRSASPVGGRLGQLDSPPHTARPSILSNLSLSTSPPVLAPIKAGSTPVTPNISTFEQDLPAASSSKYPAGMTAAPALERNPSTSTAELLAQTFDSYHAQHSREASSASSSRYSSSVPPSPAISPAPVASFTAGLDHQLSPTLGPLRIESTTGSKSTVIKPDKKKKGRASISSRGPFSGGISSEDIFGSTTDSADDALSDVPSRTSSRRSRAMSISSRKGNRSDSQQGISSDDVFGRSPTSPKVPSLSNMISGLRRHTSRSDSQASSRGGGGGKDDSRSASRAASMSASASSGQESILSDRSRTSSGKRRHRFSDVLKRKTDADRAEEEEHLRILAELRLKALALASAPDDPSQGSTSTSSSSTGKDLQRANAEMLVRDMEKHRLSRAESTSSSTYSNRSDANRNDDTITSPHIQTYPRLSSQSSFENVVNDTSSTAAQMLMAADRPSADVPLDADGSDDEARDTRKSFAATGRRATLMPTSSRSSLSDADDHPMPSNQFSQIPMGQLGNAVDDEESRRYAESRIAEGRRRSTLTPAHASSADHAKAIRTHKRSSREVGPPTGTEADIEDEENPLTSSILDRRRSTIKANHGAAELPAGIKKSRSRTSLKKSSSRPSSRDSNDPIGYSTAFSNRPERTSAIIIPQNHYPTRPRNESLSSSQSIRSIHADTVLPPVRSSSRPDSPPSSGLPLQQRSASLQSLSQRLTDLQPLHTGDPSLPLNVPSTLSVSSRHLREGASASAMQMEPESPTSPTSKLYSRNNEATDSTGTAAGLAMENPRRSSAEQAIRGGAPRPDLGYHRRSSSDMLSLAAQQRQRPSGGHHRRTSSSETKALPARPASSSQQQRRSESFLKIQQQQYAKVSALLTRNKPLPAAACLREDFKACRSAGERAILYARKINELATVESGLEHWLARTRPVAPNANDAQWAQRKGSVATVHSTSQISHFNHSLRGDNASEAAFPLRRGSQDVYKARDITQRTPSVAPSTMVPQNIPYPGVYEDSHTLRTSSAMSNHAPASTFRSQSQSFASAALNAAGLPKVPFFGGLGRKSSKRAPSSRHKASDGAAGLSISGPIRAPSPDSYSASGTRSVSLRPSGPRPSISASSSDREVPTMQAMQPFHTLPSSSSSRSLASIPQGAVASIPTMQALNRPVGSPLASITSPDEEALTAMADVLPQASNEMLAKYLAACNGDHLAAISAYFDDQRRGA